MRRRHSSLPSRTGCPTKSGTVQGPKRYLHRLQHEAGLSVTKPKAVTLGGLTGYVVTVHLRKSWTKVCPGFQPPPSVETVTGNPPSPSDLSHGIGPRPQAQRLYLLPYNGGTLGIEIFARDGTAKRLASYSKVVSTFQFAH